VNTHDRLGCENWWDIGGHEEVLDSCKVCFCVVSHRLLATHHETDGSKPTRNDDHQELGDT
jgi:hypothetical protein